MWYVTNENYALVYKYYYWLVEIISLKEFKWVVVLHVYDFVYNSKGLNENNGYTTFKSTEKFVTYGNI